MEDVIGGHVPRDRFDRFLADWERILDRRVEQAARVIGGIDGVRGLILAGSIGRGRHWPLSDIDMIPILDFDRVDAAHAEIERNRLALVEQWLTEGWWTSVDIGRLYFTREELVAVLPVPADAVPSLLDDDRWYHSFDKGYGGRPVLDPDGHVAELVRTFNTYRFEHQIAELRQRRAAQAATSARRELSQAITRGDAPGAAVAVGEAVKWFRTWQLEAWLESDASLGRVGTRFERLARARGRHDLVDELRTMSDLDDGSVRTRMDQAPEWVHERHDRSWSARQAVGEELTELDDARDVLRVCTQYQLRNPGDPPYPAWLAVPGDADSLRDRASMLNGVMSFS